ncbi:MAG: hypothetical protein HHJ10_03295 [Cellulomonas sp.]|uniref:histidine kinase N-terminal 7TM domain-containing protein n=1 Tax=Cellulomonas sp. TaxID=40001 RepID=UPI00180F1A85|nr:histidine kinase N-terminal 7TM domain-containing protein [Cellulomonas sp.]NMM30081.1 hypothetical protein [Cellulomonas sp.]
MQSLRRPQVEARHADKEGARASFVAAARAVAREGATMLTALHVAAYVGAALLLLHAAGFVCLARSAPGADWVPSRRLLALLAVEPVLVTVTAATNRWHLLFSDGPGAATLSTPSSWWHGPLFWVHTGYSYGLVVVAVGLVVIGWRQRDADGRRPTSAHAAD